MASGSSLEELLYAEFKEAFNEFDKVGRGCVINKHLYYQDLVHISCCFQLLVKGL